VFEGSSLESTSPLLSDGVEHRKRALTAATATSGLTWLRFTPETVITAVGKTYAVENGKIKEPASIGQLSL